MKKNVAPFSTSASAQTPPWRAMRRRTVARILSGAYGDYAAGAKGPLA